MLIAGAAGVYRRPPGSSRYEALERFSASPVSVGSAGIQGIRPDEQIWTPRLPSDNVLRSITTDRAGRPFVSDLRSGFRSLGTVATMPSNPPGRGLQLMFDTRGNMWVATGGQGVWRVSAPSTNADAVVERLTTITGLATEGAFSLLEDRHGNIWAGGSPSGLTRLTPQKFIPVPQESSVTALTVSPKGRVWIGTSDALIDVATPDRYLLTERRSLAGESIRALHVDSQGGLWVGTERELLRLPAGRERFEPVGVPSSGWRGSSGRESWAAALDRTGWSTPDTPPERTDGHAPSRRRVTRFGIFAPSSSATDLVEALREIGAPATGTSVEFTVVAQGIARPLGDDTERELLRMFSRMIVGWAGGPTLHGELVLNAVLMAVCQRRRPRGTVVHSDQGTQYGSDAWRRFCRSNHLEPSMSREGNCCDNAVAESFFSSLKRERIKKQIYKNRALAIADVADYIGSFYNRTRRHSYLGGLSPEQFEAAHRPRRRSLH
jgi:transposase InsO family protein